MTTTLITDYLGRGLASARPVSVAVAAGAAAFWYSTDTGELDVWDGSAWQVQTGGSYIVSGFSGATPFSANQVIFTHRFGYGVTFPANFGATAQGPTSTAGCLIDATGAPVINVDKCLTGANPTTGGSWSTIGTMTLTSGGHAVSFATVGGTAKSFAQGDFMRWACPASPDATMANFFATLAATRA